MRRSARDEKHSNIAREEIRAAREGNQDKWTGLLRQAMDRCGFLMVPENGGMSKIIDIYGGGQVVAHAPLHVASKKRLGSIMQDCGISPNFRFH